MAHELHSRTLHRSGVVVIRDVQCRAPRGDGPTDECGTSDDIVFPRRGAFVRHARGQAAFGDANAILFFNGGEPYRVTHPTDGGDDCTVLTFSAGVLADAFPARLAGAPAGAAPAFPRAEAPGDSRGFATLQRLRRLLAAGPACPVRGDEVALSLLAGAAAALAVRREHPGRRLRPATARAHRGTAFATRALLARDFAQRLTLDRIATAVNSSPFHLARLFARETGLPIHRHLARLRLREALERLAAGEDDLTTLALDLGFSSHAHFTDAFRREFGMPPSHFRRGLTSARRREMSKILEAARGPRG